MKLTTKIFAAISVTFILYAVFLFGLSQKVLIGSFKELEEDDARRNASRAISALQADVQSTRALNVDWSSWDDSYSFMTSRSDDYIKSTLNNETLAKLRLNFIAYMGVSGRAVYSKWLDHRSAEEGPAPEDIWEHMARLARKGQSEEGVDGFVTLNDGRIMLLTIHPVLTSEGDGPARGSLVMARLLDDHEVALLSRTTHMSVTVERVKAGTDYKGPEGAIHDGLQVHAHPVSDNLIAGWGVVDDLYGAPAFIMKVELPRSIYSQGKKTILYFISHLLAAAVVAVLAVALLVGRSLLNRLLAIGSRLGEIGRTGNLSLRVESVGADELAMLGCEVNRMLCSLQALEEQRRVSEEQLKAAHDKLEERVRDRTTDLEEANLALKEEITQRMHMESRIKEMAYYDHLTGLPNRVLFIDRLDQVLCRGVWHKDTIAAVLFLDLDNFKVINDTLGHSTGDELIRGVAEILSQALRTGDTVARIGGDEFTILLQDMARVDDIAFIIDKIFKGMKKPIQLGEQEVFVSASIGVAIYPHDGGDSSTLLKNADIAMYHAKSKGGCSFQMYNPSMAEKAMDRLKTGNRLRGALDRGEFALHYMPLVDLSTGKVSGSEALLRWNDPELGLVSPASFIHMAEETGLIVPMSEWVLREACSETVRLQESHPGLSVSVNISVRAFMEEDFVEQVAAALKDTGLNPAHLTLEITESLLMTNIVEAMTKMRELKELGVEFSIDDFGTGYSSLSYLKSLPIRQIKIDRSFIRDAVTKDDDRLIVTAIIKLAQSLGIDVVAEGVETREQVNLLLAQDCHKMQGYFFSKPLPAPSYESFLLKGAA